MASENPGFGAGLTFAAPLGSGRVIRQSLRLGETRRLVPVSPTKIDSAGIYGFRKILDLGRLTFAAPLGSGRVIRQSLRLGETRRLVPVSPTKIDSAGIYGFRKILDLGRG
ncbi:hypothetical protein DdX_00916 [Ditylenchus destructor]|uniref:Uncharacterized protein n=1 Tax=Ditylenchus destructor TaxID=166010 RepID=A0AAD4RAU1_9BILA|nr:hypothetical protein DdX_00916 [Ditylenchus destructor]